MGGGEILAVPQWDFCTLNPLHVFHLMLHAKYLELYFTITCFSLLCSYLALLDYLFLSQPSLLSGLHTKVVSFQIKHKSRIG